MLEVRPPDSLHQFIRLEISHGSDSDSSQNCLVVFSRLSIKDYLDLLSSCLLLISSFKDILEDLGVGVSGFLTTCCLTFFLLLNVNNFNCFRKVSLFFEMHVIVQFLLASSILSLIKSSLVVLIEFLISGSLLFRG